MSQSIINKYLTLLDEYKSKHSVKTCLLIQVGSFYEMYQPNETENLQEICEILNIQLTRKNKDDLKTNEANPLMAGFPIYLIDECVKKLNEENYCVIVYNQEEINGTISRCLSGEYIPDKFKEISVN